MSFNDVRIALKQTLKKKDAYPLHDINTETANALQA